MQEAGRAVARTSEDLKMALQMIFNIIARNPPSIAIAGGILMWIVGSVLNAGGYGGYDLLFWAPIVFFGGIILQMVWLLFVPH